MRAFVKCYVQSGAKLRHARLIEVSDASTDLYIVTKTATYVTVLHNYYTTRYMQISRFSEGVLRPVEAAMFLLRSQSA